MYLGNKYIIGYNFNEVWMMGMKCDDCGKEMYDPKIWATEGEMTKFELVKMVCDSCNERL